MPMSLTDLHMGLLTVGFQEPAILTPLGGGETTSRRWDPRGEVVSRLSYHLDFWVSFGLALENSSDFSG